MKEEKQAWKHKKSISEGLVPWDIYFNRVLGLKYGLIFKVQEFDD